MSIRSIFSARVSRRTALYAYVLFVIAGGTAAVLQSLHALYLVPVGWPWFVLVGLTLAFSRAELKIPGIDANFSMSDAFTMTAAVLFGPAAATVTVALDALAISHRLARANIPWYRVLFNATGTALAMWLSTHLVVAIWGTSWAKDGPAPLELAGPLAVLAATYFLLNTGSISLAVALEKGGSAAKVWRQHFLGLWMTYFGGAAAAGLVVVLLPSVLAGASPASDSSLSSTAILAAVLALLLVLVPLPFLLHQGFKSAMGRLDDNLRHLADLNAVYLSTIEALAHAIDAKDHLTHGHVRRVRTLAVRLARELGVTGEAECKAIEAAALLHDMGKLGVPERILNKPGKLTPAEYEALKAHASLGAEILSSIPFPYPVVPIVRHHHERWDGGGYPDGLKGAEIPFGARVLAVADCYDALTSERPYRPPLAEAAALEVLLGQRGTGYDPAVLDAFVRVYPEIRTKETEPVLAAETLNAISRAFHSEPALADLGAGATYAGAIASAFFDLHRDLAGAASPEAVGRAGWCCLKRLVPSSSFVLFINDAGTDVLRAAVAEGTHAEALSAIRMRVADRLTGWVVANRTTMVNADAFLDIVDLPLEPPLHSCLSTALVDGDRILGAITLYSTTPGGFAQVHGEVVKAAAEALGRVLATFAPVADSAPRPAALPLAAMDAAARLACPTQ